MTTIHAPLMPTMYGHTGYDAMLPPPIPGEELLPTDLILAIRDGRRSLETEDVLIQKIVDLLALSAGPRMESGTWPIASDYKRSSSAAPSRASLPAPLYWRRPGTEPSPDDEWVIESGWELLFKTSDGMPVRVSLINAEYDIRDRLSNGMPRFVKEPPVVELPIMQYLCPFSPAFPLSADFRRRAYAACPAGRFPNLSEWGRHLRETHNDDWSDVVETHTRQAIEQMVIAEADNYLSVRRAQDPRLAPPEVVQTPVE